LATYVLKLARDESSKAHDVPGIHWPPSGFGSFGRLYFNYTLFIRYLCVDITG